MCGEILGLKIKDLHCTSTVFEKKDLGLNPDWTILCESAEVITGTL